MNPEENMNPEVSESETMSAPTGSEAEQTSQEPADDTQRPSESDQERNWAAMRQNQDELRRQNEDYQRQNQELLQTVKQFVTPKQEKTEDEWKYDRSDIPTFEDTEKVVSRQAREIAKKVVAEELAQRRQQELPGLIKSSMSDFDDVVSKENVDYLMKHEPHIASGFSHIADPYEQAKATYDYLKKAGIYKGDSKGAMKRDAEVNSKKPVSPNAVGKRSSVDDNAFANGLTPELKKQLHQEMINAIKGA